jgi:hypothetical protein
MVSPRVNTFAWAPASQRMGGAPQGVAPEANRPNRPRRSAPRLRPAVGRREGRHRLAVATLHTGDHRVQHVP